MHKRRVESSKGGGGSVGVKVTKEGTKDLRALLYISEMWIDQERLEERRIPRE